MQGQIFHALLGLTFVLGLVFLFAYLMKKYAGHLVTGSMTTKKPAIVLLDVKALDPKNRLVLARCRQSEYLLLVGENSKIVDTYPIDPIEVPNEAV